MFATCRRATPVSARTGGRSLATTIHLVRHGHVENPNQVLYGRMPGFFLSVHGREQAKLLAEHFADIRLASVTSSPLERAQETAEPIAATHGLLVDTDERLLEATNVYEGAAGNLIWYTLRHPRILWALRDVRGPSWGERHVDLAARVHEMMAAIRDAHPDSHSVLVSHQAPIWVARLALERRGLAHHPRRRQCALASVTTVTFEGDQVTDVTYTEPAAAVLRGIQSGRAGA